jgi:hypothetical protein
MPTRLRRIGELDDRCFRCAVRHHAAARLDPADRGQVDDGSPAAGGHVSGGISGTGHHTHDVDRHDTVEIGQIVVEEPAVHGSGDTGVVHHDVQAAEFFDGSGHQSPDLLRIGDVRLAEESIRPQRFHQRLTLVGFDVGDDNPLYRAAADTRGTAGDGGDLAD